MGKYIFLYETTNLINNHKYIGVHETNNINDRYLGSGKLIKLAIKKYGRENFVREILKFFDNKKDAYKFEKYIVNAEFINRDDVYNITEGGMGVVTHSPEGLKKLSEDGKDKIIAKDLITNKIVKIEKSIFYNNPNRYTGVTKGISVMKNENGETVLVDQFNKPDNVIGHTKGKLVVKDKNNNCHLVDIKDERFIKGEFVALCKNKIIVKDSNGNKFSVDKDDERYLRGDLIGVTKNIHFKHKNKREILKCPHCDKTGDSCNMKRWHFDNCKNI